MAPKVLFVSFRFPPQNIGGTIRAVKFMKYLARKGWHVDIAVPDGSTRTGFEKDLDSPNLTLHPVICFRPYLRLAEIARKIRARTGNGVTPVPSSPANRARPFSLASRILKLLAFPDEAVGWHFPLKRFLRSYLVKNPDVTAVYAHGPPFSPFLALLSATQSWKGRVVFDFRDPWSRDPELSYPFPWLRRCVRRAEKKVLRSGRPMVTVSHRLKAYFVSDEPSAEGRMTVIPNGFDPEDVPVTRRPERFQIVHAGTLFHRNVRPFLEGLQLWVRRRTDVRSEIEVIFYGPPESEAEASVRQLELSDVCRFTGTLSHAEWIEKSWEAALYLMILQHGAHADSFIPGKIFEYASLGRPILAFGPSGEAQELIEQSGWGTYLSGYPPPEKVADLLGEFHARFRNGTLLLEGVPSSLAAFSRKALTEQLERILLDDSTSTADRIA